MTARLNSPRDDCGPSTWILDVLRLIQHHHVKRLLGEPFFIPRQQRIAGNAHIVLSDGFKTGVPAWPMQEQDLQVWRHPFGFAHPIGQYAGWRHHQRRTVGATGQFFRIEMGQRLHGLTKTHIVGETPTTIDLGQETHPAQGLSLVRTQLDAKAWWIG